MGVSVAVDRYVDLHPLVEHQVELGTVDAGVHRHQVIAGPVFYLAGPAQLAHRRLNPAVVGVQEEMLLLSEAIQRLKERGPLVLVRRQCAIHHLSGNGCREGVVSILRAQGLTDAGQDLLRDVVAGDSHAVALDLPRPQEGQQPRQADEVDSDDIVHRIGPRAVIEEQRLAGGCGKVGRPVGDAEVPGPVAQQVALEGRRRLDILAATLELPSVGELADFTEGALHNPPLREGDHTV